MKLYSNFLIFNSTLLLFSFFSVSSFFFLIFLSPVQNSWIVELKQVLSVTWLILAAFLFSLSLSLSFVLSSYIPCAAFITNYLARKVVGEKLYSPLLSPHQHIFCFYYISFVVSCRLNGLVVFDVSWTQIAILSGGCRQNIDPYTFQVTHSLSISHAQIRIKRIHQNSILDKLISLYLKKKNSSVKPVLSTDLF